MKFVTAVLLVFSAVIAIAAYLHLNFGGSWKGVAKEELEMFGSEKEAAPAASQKPLPGPPVATLQKGEQVTVVWDTYGKDYWACYVRNSKGQRGWVMCPEIQRV